MYNLRSKEKHTPLSIGTGNFDRKIDYANENYKKEEYLEKYLKIKRNKKEKI